MCETQGPSPADREQAQGMRARAQGMVEYGLILSFASLAATAALVTFGGGVGGEIASAMARVTAAL